MKGPRQNAQIKVPRPTRPPSAQRRDQHRRDAPRQLHRQRRRVAEVGVNGVIERRDDVPDADTVDEGAKADVLAPEPEFQQEKQDVRAQVLGAQRDAEQLRQPHVQGADGVVAEVGLLEKRNAKGDDDDARHHAHHPPGSRFAQCGGVQLHPAVLVLYEAFRPQHMAARGVGEEGRDILFELLARKAQLQKVGRTKGPMRLALPASNYSKRRFFFYRFNATALFFHKHSLWFSI